MSGILCQRARCYNDTSNAQIVTERTIKQLVLQCAALEHHEKPESFTHLYAGLCMVEGEITSAVSRLYL